MKFKLSRHVTLVAVLAAALGFGAATTWADPPGYLFMDIDNNHAMVVLSPRENTTARIFKQPTEVPGDLASAIADGAQPVGNSVIAVYNGKLYIIPDKRIKEHMASQMVMHTAGAPMQGD